MDTQTFAKDDFIRVRRPGGKQRMRGIVTGTREVGRWTLVSFQRYRIWTDGQSLVVSRPKVAIIGQDEIEHDVDPR